MFGEIKKNLKKEIKKIKDYLFPVFCVSCGIEGDVVCTSCLPFFMGELKIDKKNKNISLFVFDENYPIVKLLKEYKFNGLKEAEEVFLIILADFIIKNKKLLEDFDFFVPVPLHLRKLRERGFSQTNFLTSSLSKLAGKSFLECLKRTKYTKPQSKIKEISSKNKNVKNAFLAFNLDKIKDKKILLIDDVYTTGSTVKECEKMLIKSCSDIWSFTLLKT